MSLQLSIINCLGVFITEDDHTLLSRVNIFYTLEELIESALALGGQERKADTFSPSPSSPSFTPVFSSIPSPFNSSSSTFSPSARSIQLVTRAAMKLFIFLALQVATSGEREMSYIVSKFAAISLKRARSGQLVSQSVSQSLLLIVHRVNGNSFACWPHLMHHIPTLTVFLIHPDCFSSRFLSNVSNFSNCINSFLLF